MLFENLLACRIVSLELGQGGLILILGLLQLGQCCILLAHKTCLGCDDLVKFFVLRRQLILQIVCLRVQLRDLGF